MAAVEFLQSASVDSIQKHATDLAMKYPADLDVIKTVSQVESLSSRQQSY